MEQNLLRLAIERGELTLNAMLNEEHLNTFMLAVDAKEIPVVIIKSYFPSTVRIFRGFGKEVANFRDGRGERAFGSLPGIKDVIISRLDSAGDIVDSVIFQAKITAGMDAIMYSFRMETIFVAVQKWRVF